MIRRHLFKTLTALVLGAAVLAPVAAQAYPERPVRWVVPFPPGGAMDGIARALAEQMAQRFGQPVVIENRPGAGGNIGVDLVAKAKPDGHTLVITSIGMVTNAYLYPKLTYDPQKDFIPVSQLAVVPNILVVHPERVKARNVAELIAEAKNQPGKLTFASAGNGTSIHLAGELFTAMTGTDILHVPYRGSSPAVADLIGGQVDMMFDSVASARGHIQSGRLVPLAVTTPKRSTSMPELPTVAEAAVPGYDLTPWFGVFVPAGTPDDRVATLHTALMEAMQHPDVKARFQTLGAEPIGNTPDEFRAVLAAEATKWEKLIRERGLKAD